MPDVSLLQLFSIFFYVGLFTIGGGLVAIALMKQMIVDKGLISPELFYNMVAISESTPGPIGVNMATYLGYNFYGIPGAIVTTAAEVLPSIVCILIIARFLASFHENPIVKNVLITLRPASSGLVIVATLNIFTIALMNLPENFSALKSLETWKHIFIWKNLIFYIPLVALNLKTKIHPILVILAGAVFGILVL